MNQLEITIKVPLEGIAQVSESREETESLPVARETGSVDEADEGAKAGPPEGDGVGPPRLEDIGVFPTPSESPPPDIGIVERKVEDVPDLPPGLEELDLGDTTIGLAEHEPPDVFELESSMVSDEEAPPSLESPESALEDSTATSKTRQ